MISETRQGLQNELWAVQSHIANDYNHRGTPLGRSKRADLELHAQSIRLQLAGGK